MKKIITLLACVLVILSACNNNGANLYLLPSTVNASAEGGEFEIVVTYDGGWEFNAFDLAEYDWISLSQSEGARETNVKLTVASNPSQEPRMASVKLKAEHRQLAVLEVNQEGNTVGIQLSTIGLEVPEVGTSVTVDIFTDCKWQVKNPVSWVKVTPDIGRGNATITIDVNATDKFYTTEAVLTVCEYGGNPDNKALLTISRAGNPIPTFQVAADKKVHLASGNLQYRSESDEWHIAKPLEWIGANNRFIEPTFGGYIDLFGWGTSGKVQNVPVTQYEKDVTKYATPGEDLKGISDWGYNPVKDELYGIEGPWRTLTMEEWAFLIDNHDVDFAYCGDTYFLIIYPDGETISGPNLGQDIYCSEYTQNMVDDLISRGCALLPLAGYRDGQDVHNVDLGTFPKLGAYWTSTCMWSMSQTDSDYKYKSVALMLTSQTIPYYKVNFQTSAFYFGYSVRLASDVME